MLKEFKEFINRGNVIDLAVGVIIGGAFGKIVSSLVEDVIMPPLGLVLGKVDFASRFINLSDREFATLKAAKEAGAPVIGYGQFLNTVISFLIVAFTVFLVVRTINKMQREKEEAAAAEPSAEEKLLTEIRDLLKQNAGRS